MSIELDDILKVAHDGGASDIHLKVGLPPMYRIGGNLVALKGVDKLSQEDTLRMAKKILDERQRETFEREKEIDCAYSMSGVGRFRANIYHQRGSVGMAFRSIATKIPTLDELHLPLVLKDIAAYERGMVLVTGTTGSGKSSTLAAMINEINVTQTCHIVTIEDPIEFMMRDKRSMINQRELGQDTLTFHKALRAAMRQDPDVILIGELRDMETVEVALHAAETGHLLFSTLHTLDAAETINRIVSLFPLNYQQAIRVQLASVLKAVISQRLIPKIGGGRVPAVEIMICNQRIRELIEDPKRHKEIRDAIAEGHQAYKSQTFDQSLVKLVRGELVTFEEAKRAATSPADFDLLFQGIVSQGDTMDTDRMAGGTDQRPLPSTKSMPLPLTPSTIQPMDTSGIELVGGPGQRGGGVGGGRVQNLSGPPMNLPRIERIERPATRPETLPPTSSAPPESGNTAFPQVPKAKPKPNFVGPRDDLDPDQF